MLKLFLNGPPEIEDVRADVGTGCESLRADTMQRSSIAEKRIELGTLIPRIPDCLYFMVLLDCAIFL